MYEYDEYDELDTPHTFLARRKRGKELGCGARHYPNKAERKLLVQMMQASGQTEEQVRELKSNCVKLAQARASMALPKVDKKGYRTRRAIIIKRIKRRMAADLGVEIWDPKVEAGLQEMYRRQSPFLLPLWRRYSL